jgi:hypothetical protein
MYNIDLNTFDIELIINRFSNKADKVFAKEVYNIDLNKLGEEMKNIFNITNKKINIPWDY